MDADEAFDNHWPYARQKPRIPRQNAARYFVEALNEPQGMGRGWAQCDDEAPGARFWCFSIAAGREGEWIPQKFATRAEAQTWIDAQRPAISCARI